MDHTRPWHKLLALTRAHGCWHGGATHRLLNHAGDALIVWLAHIRQAGARVDPERCRIPAGGAALWGNFAFPAAFDAAAALALGAAAFAVGTGLAFAFPLAGSPGAKASTCLRARFAPTAGAAAAGMAAGSSWRCIAAWCPRPWNIAVKTSSTFRKLGDHKAQSMARFADSSERFRHVSAATA